MKRAIKKVVKELENQKIELRKILQEMEEKESDMMAKHEDWDFTDKGMEFQEKMGIIDTQIEALDVVIIELLF